MIGHHRLRFVAVALVGILTVAASITGSSQRTPIAVPTNPGGSDQVQTVPFILRTHCGINELMVNGRYFQRVNGLLDDGSHNPPAGWDNPSQSGTLTISGDIAVFRDKVGHVEVFEARPSATGDLAICS